MKRILIFILSVSMWSCKGDVKDTKAQDQNTQQNIPNQPQPSQNSPIAMDKVPDPTTLISKEEMEQFLNLPADGIYDVVSNANPSTASKAIFYKISDPELANAAVLISTYGNPLTNDVTDESWAFLRIDNLKAQGAGKIDNPDEFEKYLDWDMGVDGAYNKELGKYFWRDSNHIVYFIAFNTTIPVDQQYEIAVKLGKKLTP